MKNLRWMLHWDHTQIFITSKTLMAIQVNISPIFSKLRWMYWCTWQAWDLVDYLVNKLLYNHKNSIHIYILAKKWDTMTKLRKLVFSRWNLKIKLYKLCNSDWAYLTGRFKILEHANCVRVLEIHVHIK